jgi:hypothetical protein
MEALTTAWSPAVAALAAAALMIVAGLQKKKLEWDPRVDRRRDRALAGMREWQRRRTRDRRRDRRGGHTA